VADPRRLFFAVWPDAVAARALAAAAREAQAGCGGRAMRRDTLHLTLAFLGELVEARQAEAMAVAAAIRAEPFDLHLDRLGYWPHNRILWAGGDCPPLAALAAALNGALAAAGFRLDRRAFAIHLTLLRNVRCPVLPPLAGPIAWPVREFVLARSRLAPEGAAYEIVGRWPLG
jgi:2'-5' RNA ligase